ncbi:hypothetical protein CR513_44661, partial [Mucuna pruriens]
MTVPKKDRKPKDNFSLPHIDMLVGNTAQHSFYSFMDGFSGYNQIWKALEDKEKPPSSPPRELSTTRSCRSDSRTPE